MTKKFDVVIGNPPYQEEARGGTTSQMPIYHHFMDAAHDAGRKAVLITPARFLFDAGYTPKAWNRKMLEDPHLSVPIYVPDSSDLFPGTDIKGGVAVSYRDDTIKGEPIGAFARFPQLSAVVNKVAAAGGASIVALGITNDRVYRYTDLMHDQHPNAAPLMSEGNQYKLDSRAFERLPFIYFSVPPQNGASYRRVLGLDSHKRRAFRWILSDYISGPLALGKFKVALPKANGSGAFGETLSSPVVLEPEVAVTSTFITIGAFETEIQAQACLAYISSKFARALLGVLKVTQDNLARVWERVPLQDFTEGSDIDWSRPLPEIDQQLYAKYGLSDEEIEFIETHVQPMD